MTEHASPASASQQSTGELVQQLTEQTSRLIRDELKLAQAEMTRKGTRLAKGAGLFSGSGVIALYAIGCLLAAAIAGLATVLAVWLAALIVGAALLLIAGDHSTRRQTAGERGHAADTAGSRGKRQGRCRDNQRKCEALMADQAGQSPAPAAAADAPSDTERAIAADIERTRAELGETVEQLAAKADVKARARHAASDLEGRVRQTAGQLRGQASARGQQLGDQLTQLTDGMPDQVTGSAKAASATVRRYWMQLAAAAAVLALVAVAARKRRHS